MSSDLKLLLITDQGLRAYGWHQEFLALDQEFSADTDGLRRFRAYLDAWRRLPFRILADLPDEGFQLETLPPARGADRQAILARRLAQAAAGTPYACALSLGHEPDGRGDERVLIATLNRSEHLSPWIDRCLEAGTRLQQIATPPLLLSRLAARPSRHEGRYLLYTLGAGGLRQTCFEDGQLQFSRLLGHAPRDLHDLAATCRHEARRIGRYQQGGRRGVHGDAFHVMLSERDSAHFPIAPAEEGEADIQIVDLENLEAAHGVTPAPAEGSRCDRLLLHLWAQDEVGPGFAPASALHAQRVWQWQGRLAQAARLGLALGLVALAGLGLRTYFIDAEARRQEGLNAQMDQEYQSRIAMRPPLPMPASALARLAADFNALQRQSADPGIACRLLGRALDQVAEVALNRIDWRLVQANRPQGAATAVALATLDFSIAGEGDPTDHAERLITALQGPPSVRVERLPRRDNDDGETAPSGDFSLRLTVEAAAR